MREAAHSLAAAPGRAPVVDVAALRHLGLPLTSLTADSRQVLPGMTFAAYPGETHDGRHFIPQAIEAGAAAVLWEKEGFCWDGAWPVAQQGIDRLRSQISAIAGAVYGHPSHQLQVVGITGTNGKTSCSHWLAALIQYALQDLAPDAQSAADVATGVTPHHAQRACAVVGTLGNGFPGHLEPTANTTPDAIVLQQALARYVASGARYCAMEVSSHALEQERVSGIRFAGAVLTNLTRDHLDYHGSLQAYAAAKTLLFYAAHLEFAVLNLDDALGQSLVERLQAGRPEGGSVLEQPVRLIGYTQQGRAIPPGVLGLSAEQVATPVTGAQFVLRSAWGEAAMQTALVGPFNIANVLAVLGAALALGFPLSALVRGVSQLQAPPGRLERWGGQDRPWVVVDYAHTPDALEQVLQTLRAGLPPRGQLWCVFGCGGNRDPGKRPLMGELAGRLADHVVLTSDNPREESPEAILDQVAAGMNAPYTRIVERAQAIRFALQKAGPADVVLIAGKGHETTQEIAGRSWPFSDRAVVQEWMQGSGT